MPRKPLSTAYRKRFSNNSASMNASRQFVKSIVRKRYSRAWVQHMPVRNPLMKPLLKNGRKHVQQ